MIADKSSLIVSIVPLVIVKRSDDFAVICDRGFRDNIFFFAIFLLQKQLTFTTVGIS